MYLFLSNCVRVVLVFVMSVIYVSSLFAQDDDQVEVIRQIYKKQIASSVIDISGSITDTEGKKLDNVEISISYSRPKNMWSTESETVYDFKLSNGGFSIEKKHYTTVTLYFFKEGYYPKTIHFYTGKKPNEKNSAIQDNLSIVLRETGPLAELIKFNGDLDYDVKATTKSVCNLSNLEKGKMSSETYNWDDAIKGMYLYLDFERNENGEIILGGNARGTNAPAPQTYVLHFASPYPDEGLIVLNNARIPDITYLTEAPAKGYTIKKYKIKYPLDEDLYFYIKCDNFFGKGKMSSLDAISELGHSFSLSIMVLFNKESENRNVRSY